MTGIFYELLNMSLKASYVILAVILVRFLLKKAPKKYSYALWAAAAFRLVCPVSFKSALSLFSIRMSKGGGVDLTVVPTQVIDPIVPQANVGAANVDAVINNSLPAPTPQYSANPMQIVLFIAMIVWLTGIAVLLVYSIVSYISLHRKLRFAVKLEDNIWQSDVVSSPFIMGFIRPRIYIPFGMDTDKLSYVLSHEKEHIRRFDHIVKPLAFLILTVHWFNPLVWLGFYLMSRDMEMSCDEKVLLNDEVSSKDYSTTLLSLAVKGRFPAPSPLAFGESNVKGRIKNALSFKKPAVWISIIAVIICIVVIFICAADPKEPEVQANDIFQSTYAIPELVYVDGKYSFVPVTDDTASYYIDKDGTVFHKGWTEEAEWDELGTLESFTLTKVNFDDYFEGGGEMWEDGYSIQKLREENKNAWKFKRDGNLHYVLQQDNGEVLYAAILNHMGTDDISVIGEGVPDEFCVRWIYRMEPVEAGELPEYSISGESYVSYECLYMSPVSSFAAIGGDSGYRYVITDNEALPYYHGFVMIDRSTGDIKTIGTFSEWEEFPYTEEEWNELFMMYPVDISGFEEKQWMAFDGSNGYALAKMDDQLWFVDLSTHTNGDEYMWSVYSLVSEEYMGEAVWEYSEGETLKIEFDIPGNMTAVCTQSGISADGENFDMQPAWKDGCLYWMPVDENGKQVLNAQIHFTSDTGCAGIVYITGGYTNSDVHYTVTTSGTGLYMSQEDDGTIVISVR